MTARFLGDVSLSVAAVASWDYIFEAEHSYVRLMAAHVATGTYTLTRVEWAIWGDRVRYLQTPITHATVMVGDVVRAETRIEIE